MDEVTVSVEARAQLSEIEAGGEAKVLRNLIKEVIGVSAIVRIQQPGAIARSAGKANRVRDRRTP
jgi:phenylacetate-CoA ligase